MGATLTSFVFQRPARYSKFPLFQYHLLNRYHDHIAKCFHHIVKFAQSPYLL